MNTQMQTLMSQRIFNSNTCRILFATCLSALCLTALSTEATTITVMNTNDSGPGSLRQALTDANEGDTIDFGVTGTITLTTGQLVVDKSVSISGPGAANLAVNSNAASRVFHITNAVTVSTSGLTITNGSVVSSDVGGGAYNDQSTLTVSNCTLSGNSAGAAGGIDNDGRYGGATLTINNSTFSGNSVNATGGIRGAILNDHATITIGDTILNTGGASGENIYNAGTITSNGYNLSNDNGGGLLTGMGDQINTDPMLGPLQDNGGPTFTHALLTSSPAIDAGDTNFNPNSFNPPMVYDQRGTGFNRVVNGRIDIGAFEVQAVPSPYAGQVQQPINGDGSSVFSVRRGVVPVKFTLTQGSAATCDLPPATIALTRTAGGTTRPIDESIYTGSVDSGSNFRIDSCHYIYNLSASALGVGTYRVDIKINGQVIDSAVFQLK